LDSLCLLSTYNDFKRQEQGKPFRLISVLKLYENQDHERGVNLIVGSQTEYFYGYDIALFCVSKTIGGLHY